MVLAKFDVEFDKNGNVYHPEQLNVLLEAASKATDVLFLSHGWNNNKQEAADLYAALTDNIEKCLQVAPPDKINGKTVVVAQIYWPSKKFEDAELIPGGGAASLDGGEHADSLRTVLTTLTMVPSRLGQLDEDPVRIAIVEQAKAAIPDLASATGQARFLSALRSIVDLSAASDDDGSTAFFTEDPHEIFERLEENVPALVLPVGDGGAANFEADGAASVSDLFDGVIAAARRLANYTTYCDMKQRAGLVGSTGVAKMVMLVRQKNPNIRIHLAGHSFGGRLVTAAASALPPDTPNVTLSLLQAAFSHNGFARDFDERKHDGAFLTVVRDRRVSGPIIITHTKNDQAVGIAYPLASRISRDPSASLGDQDDPYGGMGRNGAQHMKDLLATNPNTLGPSNTKYAFTPGKIFNLRADDAIANHSDVTNAKVANAVVQNMLSVYTCARQT
jgi:hypothetical protein